MLLIVSSISASRCGSPLTRHARLQRVVHGHEQQHGHAVVRARQRAAQCLLELGLRRAKAARAKRSGDWLAVGSTTAGVRGQAATTATQSSAAPAPSERRARRPPPPPPPPSPCRRSPRRTSSRRRPCPPAAARSSARPPPAAAAPPPARHPRGLTLRANVGESQSMALIVSLISAGDPPWRPPCTPGR
jgi:hypothetical protein